MATANSLQSTHQSFLACTLCTHSCVVLLTVSLQIWSSIGACPPACEVQSIVVLTVIIFCPQSALVSVSTGEHALVWKSVSVQLTGKDSIVERVRFESDVCATI